MGTKHTRYKILLPMLVSVLFAFSCKQKCYDCIVTDVNTQERDTLNTLCTDNPQYTGSYLTSWKILCAGSNGETVVRDKD